MRSAVLLFSLVAMTMRAQGLSTIEGIVTIDNLPLPGCTVSLRSDSVQRTDVTSVEGHYLFTHMPPGDYELRFELAGLQDERIAVHVEHESTVVIPPQELRVSEVTEEITLSCGRPCTEEPPTNRYEQPRCADYELHDALIAAAKNGDQSAIDLLQGRFATADTLSERYRLGAALLDLVSDDQGIWNELAERAEVAVRFPASAHEAQPDYLQWCTENGVADPNEHWWSAVDALREAAHDARSNELLRRALATEEGSLAFLALDGFAQQRDFTALPLIDAYFERNPDSASSFAQALAAFFDERADSIAFQWIDEDGREEYAARRQQAAAQQR
jgi:hypothetical protein